MKIALIGCSKSKISRPAPARDLYTGQLFRAALAYAESQRFDRVYVLSAKHGAVPLDREIHPYDDALQDRKPIERRSWATRVAALLSREAGPQDAPGELVIFAGSVYATPLRIALSRAGSLWKIETPLAGLGIGQQKAWFFQRRPPMRSLSDLVLDLDRQYPGAADAEVILPAVDWQRLVRAARGAA